MQDAGVKLKNEYLMQIDQENVQSQKLQRGKRLEIHRAREHTAHTDNMT